MRNLIQHVDRLLRGGYTTPDDLRAGRIPARARVLARLGLVLGMAYGVFMGLYAVAGPGDARGRQERILVRMKYAFRHPCPRDGRRFAPVSAGRRYRKRHNKLKLRKHFNR